MMYKTAAFVPVDMGDVGQHPLLLLQDCMESERTLAVVREGGAMVSAPAFFCFFVFFLAS